jgi:hypothetical protein
MIPDPDAWSLAMERPRAPYTSWLKIPYDDHYDFWNTPQIPGRVLPAREWRAFMARQKRSKS